MYEIAFLTIIGLAFVAGFYTRHKLDGVHDRWRYGRKT